MEIKLKNGIGNLKFGMTENEIIKILGKPNKRFVDEDDDNQIISECNDKKLRLTFYKNFENRLGYLRTKNENLTFNQNKIIGQKTEVVKNYFKNEIIDWEITEYHFFVDYFNENYWLSLHSEFANIVNFEMGVPFNENEEYDWPELSLSITRVWRNGG